MGGAAGRANQVNGYMWVMVWYFMFCFDQVRRAHQRRRQTPQPLRAAPANAARQQGRTHPSVFSRGRRRRPTACAESGSAVCDLPSPLTLTPTPTLGVHQARGGHGQDGQQLGPRLLLQPPRRHPSHPRGIRGALGLGSGINLSQGALPPLPPPASAALGWLPTHTQPPPPHRSSRRTRSSGRRGRWAPSP